MRGSINISVQRDFSTGKARLYITKYEEGAKDTKSYIGNIIWEEFAEGSFVQPTMFVDMDRLQGVANDLDVIGIKPTSQNAQRGELAATKYHLEDMRKLAKVK